MEKIEINNLSFRYGNTKALDGISLSLAQGDFLVLCGRSGCGKSTLLRQFKPALATSGTRSGEILIDGKPVTGLSEREQASRIAFVTQNPDDQIVADKVWHELAFGLESLGFENAEIRRRVAEMASFFGIKEQYNKNVSELSGGQKQLLCIASAMTLEPELLILDEPTSQLDPIAASELISTLGRINRELGTTVILSEHRPEDSFGFANKVAVMESGKLVAFGNPSEVGKRLREESSPAFFAMPAAMRVYAGVGFGECPVTVRDGRKWLNGFSKTHEVKKNAPRRRVNSPGETMLSADEIWFRYEKELPDTVKGLSLEVGRGEMFALLGSNGSGMTTTLRLLAGLEEPQRGEITRRGKIGMLPQDPKLLLNKGSVRDELGLTVSQEKFQNNAAWGERSGMPTNPKPSGNCVSEKPEHTSERETLQRNAAVGEQISVPTNQKSTNTDRVHDEPNLMSEQETPEFNAASKRVGANGNPSDGNAVCDENFSAGQHDQNSAGAEHRDANALIRLCRLGGLLDRHPYSLSGGEQQRVALAKVLITKPDILLLDEPTKGLDAVFRITLASILDELRKNGTAILLVSHDTEFCAAYADRCGLFFDGAIVSTGEPAEFFGGMSYYTTPTSRIARGICDAVTPDGLITACGGTPLLPAPGEVTVSDSRIAPEKKKLPLWRKLLAGSGAVAALACFIMALRTTDLSALKPGNLSFSDLRMSVAFIVSLAVTAFALGSGNDSTPGFERRLSKQTIVSMLIMLIVIPATVIFGLKLPGRAYYLTSLAVLIECMLPFFAGFESRKPTSREVARIASLCALGVAGRAAFFMLPQFKPVLAITIISGVNFGCETGFLVGAVTMLTSNILFSQGPWTPWQMFAMGLCGAVAGIIFRRKPNRVALCVYGGLSAVGIYGVIMNLSSAVIWQSELSLQSVIAYLIAGFPMDCVHAAATVLFLWILNSKTFMSAFDRQEG